MYKRIVRFEARRNPTDEPFLVIKDLRFTFNTDVGLAQGLGKTRISIYNLGHDTIKALTAGDYEPASTGTGTAVKKEDERINPKNKVWVKFFVGYADIHTDKDMPLLVDGFVMNATSYRKRPENITHLYILPVASGFMKQNFKPFHTYGKTFAMPLHEVLTKVCVDTGFEPSSIEIRLSEAAANQPVREYVEPNEKTGLLGALFQLADTYKFTFSQRLGGIGFYPKVDDSKAGNSEFNTYVKEDGKYAPFLVRPELLRGSPVIGVGTIEIPHVLDVSIHPGYVLDTQAIVGKQPSDTSLPSGGLSTVDNIGDSIYYSDDVARYAVLEKYMALRIVHKGDTHGEEWSTTIVGHVPTIGDTANEEA